MVADRLPFGIERRLKVPLESAGLGSTTNEYLKAVRRGIIRLWDWMISLSLGDRKRQALSEVLESQDIPWDDFGLFLQRVTRLGVRAAKSDEDLRAARAGGLTAQRIFFSPLKDRSIQLMVKMYTSDQDAQAMQLRIIETFSLRLADWDVTRSATLPKSPEREGENITYGEIQLRRPLGMRSIRLAGKSVGPNLVLLMFEAPIDNPWNWPDLTLVALKQLEKLKGHMPSSN